MQRLLLILAVVFAAVLGLQWTVWHPESAVEPPNDVSTEPVELAIPAAPVIEELLDPPLALSDYSTVTARPLFLESRRPPEPEVSASDAATDSKQETLDLSTLDIQAILITDKERVAWLKRSGANELQRLRLGDALDGWTVQRIEPEQLILERQGVSTALPLQQF